MSAENDLALAYHMGYDDALAKRKPDASKAQVLAPYNLATENAKLRELVRDMRLFILLASATAGVSILVHGKPTLGMEAFERRMRELGVDL